MWVLTWFWHNVIGGLARALSRRREAARERDMLRCGYRRTTPEERAAFAKQYAELRYTPPGETPRPSPDILWTIAPPSEKAP